MKRIISLLSLFIMLLMLVACSGGCAHSNENPANSENTTETHTEEPQEKDTLIGIEFEDVYSTRKLVLNEDNTFTFGEYSGNWERAESNILLSYEDTTANGSVVEIKHTLKIKNDDGVCLAEETPGKMVFPDSKQLVLEYLIECYERERAETVRKSITKEIGTAVSTDCLELTVESAEFCFYASSYKDTYAQPIPDPQPKGIFYATKGRTLVALTIRITNLDRATIQLAGYNGWEFSWKVVYNGMVYDMKGYDLNHPDGWDGLNFHHSVISHNDGKSFDFSDSISEKLDPGKTLVARVIGVIKMEPESLDDSFDILVNLLNSDIGNDWFIYHVE